MNGVGMFLFEVSDFTSDFWVLPTLTMYNVASAYDASWRASLYSRDFLGKGFACQDIGWMSLHG